MPPSPSLDDIAQKVSSGTRLNFEDGLRLLAHPNLTEVGAMAQSYRRFIVGETTTYSAALRLEWTTLEGPVEELEARLGAMAVTGVSEERLTGELPESWSLDRTVNAFRAIRERQPGAQFSGFTPDEILRLVDITGCSPQEVLETLQKEGLSALGPFLFDPSTHSPQYGAEEASSLTNVLQSARTSKLSVTVQLHLSPDDTPETRLNGLFQLREMQDLTGAIPTLLPLNMNAARNYTGSAFDYLRMMAVARLIVDNVPHLQSSWESHDLKVAQLALQYGADDFGTLWLETQSAGPLFSHPIHEVERNIQEVGFIPQARNARYEPVPAPQLPVPAESIGFAPMPG